MKRITTSLCSLAIVFFLFVSTASAQQYIYNFNFSSSTGGTVSGYMVVDSAIPAEEEFLGYTPDQIRVVVDNVIEVEATSVSASGTVRNFVLDPAPHISESVDELGNTVVTVDTDPDAQQTGAIYSTEIGGSDPQLPSGLFNVDENLQGIGFLFGAAVVDQNGAKDELVIGIINEGSTDLDAPTSTPTVDGVILGFGRLNFDDETVVTFDGNDTGVFTVQPVSIEAQIDEVIDNISDLVDDGSLSPFAAFFLERRLEQAKRDLDRGRPARAIRRLQQAISTTALYDFFGIISNEDADNLINAMNAIIDQINDGNV